MPHAEFNPIAIKLVRLVVTANVTLAICTLTLVLLQFDVPGPVVSFGSKPALGDVMACIGAMSFITGVLSFVSAMLQSWLPKRLAVACWVGTAMMLVPGMITPVVGS